jgi:hypothetical protein
VQILIRLIFAGLALWCFAHLSFAGIAAGLFFVALATAPRSPN